MNLNYLIPILAVILAFLIYQIFKNIIIPPQEIMLNITPLQFLNACSQEELDELELLLPQFQNPAP